MAFGKFDSDSEDEVLSEINMIPLIDVMLVLLIVFIITVPVIRHAVQLELPQATSQPSQERPATIRLAIDAQGQYHWNEAAISDQELQTRLDAAAAQQPQPELHLSGDKAVRYERVAQAMAAAQRAGLGKIGFLTRP
ncbi:ExbD/TolR family protein [Malikia spinosa]|jgi:biopolymer transport protein ExbD|uniref:Biopolymer transporter ExbD n=1 Tax=Malikia spinosa TaxID=86180 RepID=A0A2S9KGV4_9BURK|nr:biopolymer transporter ExbD [Malikia spinosa]MYZ54189.1 biopolymer transporter ExbD [Malikia spinosa]OGB72982.1 MAG: biopolymer transporter ExbD [Burkholderiales bacterium RIFOXYC12_FULL_65_23]PRD69672.1 biopolymer transporter ExbD [Malikia spinosa]